MVVSEGSSHEARIKTGGPDGGRPPEGKVNPGGGRRRRRLRPPSAGGGEGLRVSSAARGNPFADFSATRIHDGGSTIVGDDT